MKIKVCKINKQFVSKNYNFKIKKRLSLTKVYIPKHY